MRKLISISLFLLYLFTTTEMYQLIKMPLLVQHLHAHEAGNKNETLWSFLEDHYINSSDKDPDYAADMQLPFKTQERCVACNINATTCVAPQTIIVIKPVIKQQITYTTYKQPFSSYTFPSNIWQPPKNC